MRLLTDTNRRHDARGAGRVKAVRQVRVGQVNDDAIGVIEREEFVDCTLAHIQGDLRCVRPGGQRHGAQFPRPRAVCDA